MAQRGKRGGRNAGGAKRARAGRATTATPPAKRRTSVTPRKASAAKPRRTPARPSTSGAQALVTQLEALGVEVVFGIPGVHNLAIFDALRRSAIRTIVVRHEQTAAYAADGYARATGRLGVCVTTTGPGAANTAAAMGEARASRSPVLQISTQIASALLDGRGGRWSLHESPHQRALMDAVSVWAGTVARAEAIPSMVLRAAAEAMQSRRGPAFLEIPHDLLDEPVTWAAQPPLRDRWFRPTADAVTRATALLNEAKRPIIWAGGGAVSAEAGPLILKAAEALQAPIVTTFAAKGIVPPDHPLLVGFPPHQPQVTSLLAKSDAILVVGSDLDGMNTQGWRIALPRPRVVINMVAEDARRNYAADLVIESHARVALEEILPGLRVRRGAAGERRVATARAAADTALRASAEFAEPYAFVETVAGALQGDAMVIADMAVAGYWVAAYHRAAAPRSFAYPLGWGTLGFALPAAIGAAAAGRRVLVVTGDAGFSFAPSELATAVQEGLPITVLIVDDAGYGMLRFDERERFGDEFAADLHSPNFASLARAFGVQAKVATLPDLGAALRWAMRRKGPAVVTLEARFTPPLTTSPRWPLKGKPEARP